MKAQPQPPVEDLRELFNALEASAFEVGLEDSARLQAVKSLRARWPALPIWTAMVLIDAVQRNPYWTNERCKEK